MPIEIKELHIKVTVNQPPNEQRNTNGAGNPKNSENDKDALISHCVEEVMSILKHKKER